MQTFLAYPDFERSAQVLDDRRLGKQRVETLQVLRALHLDGYGWSNHPAVTMWRGHTAALVSYGTAVVDEWEARGHADSTRHHIAEFVHPQPPRSQDELAASGELPPWLGRADLHRSHRSALARKDPDHYRPRFADTPDDLDYVWPDPPAPQRERGCRDAWVVRGNINGDANGDGQISLPAHPSEHPWVPIDERSGRTTKRQRQIGRFICHLQAGDLLVTPDRDGRTLHVGRVAGDYEHRDDRHRRPVRWLTTVARGDLAFPAALQDPQDVFTLHDEPSIARFADDD